MIPIRDLFETHLTVSDLQRSMSFFGDTLGLRLAGFPGAKSRVLLDRRRRLIDAGAMGDRLGSAAHEPAHRVYR